MKKFVFCLLTILSFCRYAIFPVQQNPNPSEYCRERACLERECDAGDLGQCTNLGLLESAEGNIEESIRRHDMACLDGKGIMLGCSNLGTTKYLAGDHDEAKRLWKMASDGGAPIGYTNLGLYAYQEERDIDKAREFLTMGINGGDKLGLSNLGAIEFDLGNIPEARRLLEIAWDDGDGEAHAGHNLAIMARREGDRAEGKRLHRMACNRGIPPSCIDLKRLQAFERRNVPL